METGLHAIIIGPTGAVGREIVDILLQSNTWSKLTLVVRRKIDRWTNISPQLSSKLLFIESDNLDFLAGEKSNQETIFNNGPYDSLFCCLGSRVGKGKEEFIKVDYTYVMNSAFLCQKLDIKHFSLISSGGANSKSCFLYLRTKGQADEDVVKYIIDYVSIFRPGVLYDRDNDKRCIESLLKCCCCIPGISCKNLSKVVVHDAEEYHRNGKKRDNHIYEHSEIIKILKGL
jgi:oxidoreductase